MKMTTDIFFCVLFIVSCFEVNAVPLVTKIDHQLIRCKFELRAQLDKTDPKMEAEQWRRSFEFLDNDEMNFQIEIAAAEKNGKNVSSCLNFWEKQIVEPRKKFSWGHRRCLNEEWQRLQELINNHQLITINDENEIQIVPFQDGEECVRKLHVPSTPTPELKNCFDEEFEKLRKISKDISIDQCISN